MTVNSMAKGPPGTSRIMLLAGITVLTGMTIYENLKQWIWPDISIWQSHIVTISFTSVLAIFIAAAICRTYNALIRALLREHECRRKAEKELEKQNEYLMKEIGDRKQTEEALRESEELFRRTFDQAPIGAAILDLHGRFQRVNPEMSRITGYSEQELISVNFGDITHPDHRVSDIENVEDLVSGRMDHFKVDKRYVRADGEIIWARTSVQLVKDISGNPLYLLPMVEDITDRKNAEAALREAEERFSKSFMNNPAWLAIVHMESNKVLEVNDAWTRIFGYTREEAIGRTTVELGIYDEEVYRKIIEEARANGSVKNLEVTIKTRTGEDRVLLVSREVIGIGGEPHLLAMGLDIAERKRADEALRESEEKYRDLFNNAEVGMFRTRLDGSEILDFNEKFLRIFGWTREEMRGKSSVIHWADPRKREEMIQRISNDGSVTDYECTLRNKQGEVRHCVTSLRPYGEPGTLEGSIIDITERKKTEEALRLSQAELASIFNSISDAVIFTDRERRILRVNPAFTSIWGYAPEEAIGRTTEFLYADKEGYQEEGTSRYHVNEGAETPLFVQSWRRKDGSVFPSESLGVQVKDPEGNVIGFLGVHRDITSRKQAEKALTAHRNRLRSIIENEPECVKVVDLHGRLVEMNPAGLAMLEVESLEEAQQSSLIDYIIPEYHAAFGQLFQKVLQGESDTLEFEILGRRGTRRWCDTHAAPLCDEHGRVTALLGVTRDITERKLAEEALKVREKQYRTLFEESMDGVYSVLRGGEITDANASFCEIFGYTREELIGKNIRELYFDPADRSKFQEEIEKTGFVKDYELKFRRRDGTEVDCLLTSSVYPGQNGSITGYRGILRDLTLRKGLQKQLLQAQKMEAIGRLAGGIAHDFNNLLTVMVGYSSMLKAQFPQGSPQADKLAQIVGAADRASGLTRQLLAFSRKQVMEMRVIDLNEVVRDTEKMLNRILGEDIEMLTVCGASPCTVMADQDQVVQIIMNLAVNARDAMPEGGKLTIETVNAFLDSNYAAIHAEVEPGHYVMLAFSDNGVGMDAETQARIFEPFFTTKGKGVGTGLGLATVFGIVKQHKGHVTVYSEPGRGSSFRVYFPQTESPVQKVSETDGSRIRTHGEETVLVVEDEEFVRDYACEVLDSLGYVTLAAKDPEEAIALSRKYQGPIHLLLTDVIMPIMDGRSLFDRIHPQRPEMQVIYMSGYTDEAIVNHGVLDAGVHFLQKPFSVNRLAEKVSEVLVGRAKSMAEGGLPGDPMPSEMDESMARRRLADLPPELVEELSRAAQEANRRKTAELLTRVRGRDEALAKTLESLLVHFRFDKIISLAEPQGEV